MTSSRARRSGPARCRHAAGGIFDMGELFQHAERGAGCTTRDGPSPVVPAAVVIEAVTATATLRVVRA